MRYSRWEIDEFIEQTQLARARERSESAEWQLVEDEWSDVLGPVLREIRAAGQAPEERMSRGWHKRDVGGVSTTLPYSGLSKVSGTTYTTTLRPSTPTSTQEPSAGLPGQD